MNSIILAVKGLERIACMVVDELPVAALLRAEPELAGGPLVVAEGTGGGSRVLAASREAGRAGVRPGMTVAQARSLVAGCLIRQHSPAAARSTLAALEDLARAFSPRVALLPAGEVYLGLAGLERLYPCEQRLARLLQQAARQQADVAVKVGVGSSRLVARLAALSAEHGVQVVAAGREGRFLEPLPLELLVAGGRELELCHLLGLERLGQLARLSPGQVRLRLGPGGERLWRQACGLDPEPLAWQPAGERALEQIDSEYPLVSLESLSFALQRLAERLAGRLRCRGLAATRLDLWLQLDPVGRDERPLELASPCCCPDTWREVAAASLERRPPRQPVSALTLGADIVARPAGQLELFSASAAYAADLDGLCSRLVARLGRQRVGRPQRVDSHLPGSFALEPLLRPGSAHRAEYRQRPGWPAMRALRPAWPLQLELDDAGRPRRILAGPARGAVVRRGGPWRVGGQWWEGQAAERDYYEVELSGGRLLRLYQERPPGHWLADGVFG